MIANPDPLAGAPAGRTPAETLLIRALEEQLAEVQAEIARAALLLGPYGYDFAQRLSENLKRILSQIREKGAGHEA